MYECKYCKYVSICPRGQHEPDSWCPNFEAKYKSYFSYPITKEETTDE